MIYCGVCDKDVPDNHDVEGEYKNLPLCRHCGERIIERGGQWEHYLSGSFRCELTAQPTQGTGQ